MLIDISTASPPYKILQTKAAEELKKRMDVRPAIRRLIDAASINSGIDSRFIVVPDAEENVENKFYSDNGTYTKPDTQLRMNEYERWSKKLSKEAVGKLIDENNFDTSKIERLIT
ncbi:MAG TPA: hypothetical protein VLN45_04670, partial [Ignavibacteriaceae bacterium]|nr:hypothetical protein [Ignavibacteriaceae bacterium]